MTRQLAVAGALLLLLGSTIAEAQTGSANLPGTDKRRPKPHEGTIRQLVCRGFATVQLTRRPEFDRSREVAITMTYGRNPRAAGDQYQHLEPGACTWNPLADSAGEPGRVHFYLAREGSAWVPDTATFPRYMGDPSHYWVFYINDLTHVANSHGAFRERFYVGDVRGDQSRMTVATSLRREELRCRGGSGLSFARGATVGSNLVTMTLTYPVAARAAGPAAQGLDPGTCGWVERTDAKPEPGRIAFITPANSQLRQVQSGTPVDRSPTAAERHADAITIPPYMADPRHYWRFMVSLADPDSARSHAMWQPSVTDIITATPPSEAPTTVSAPVSGTSSPVDDGGPAGASTTRAGAGLSGPR